MRRILIHLAVIVLLGTSSALALNETFPEIRTTQGVVYKNCKVTKVEPHAITLTHADGAAKVPFDQLPESIQTKYHYDPKAAQDYISAELARREATLNQMLKTDSTATLSSLYTSKPASRPTLPTPRQEPANRVTKAELLKVAKMIGIDGSVDSVATPTYINGEFVRPNDTAQYEAERKAKGFYGDIDQAAHYAEELLKKDTSIAERHYLDNFIKASNYLRANSLPEYHRLIEEIKYFVRTINI